MGGSAPSEQPPGGGASASPDSSPAAAIPLGNHLSCSSSAGALGRIPRIRTSNTDVKRDRVRIFITNGLAKMRFRRLPGPREGVMSPRRSCRFSKQGSIFKNVPQPGSAPPFKGGHFKEAHFLSSSCTVALCQGPIIVMRV